MLLRRPWPKSFHPSRRESPCCFHYQSTIRRWDAGFHCILRGAVRPTEPPPTIVTAPSCRRDQALGHMNLESSCTNVRIPWKSVPVNRYFNWARGFSPPSRLHQRLRSQNQRGAIVGQNSIRCKRLRRASTQYFSFLPGSSVYRIDMNRTPVYYYPLLTTRRQEVKNRPAQYLLRACA